MYRSEISGQTGNASFLLLEVCVLLNIRVNDFYVHILHVIILYLSYFNHTVICFIILYDYSGLFYASRTLFLFFFHKCLKVYSIEASACAVTV